MQTIKKDLEAINININLNNQKNTLETLIELTSDRVRWRHTVSRLMGNPGRNIEE